MEQWGGLCRKLTFLLRTNLGETRVKKKKIKKNLPTN